MPEGGAVAPKPANLSSEEAAALPFGGLPALSFLRRGAVRPGDRVHVNGASGAVGSASLQLARHFGADAPQEGQHRPHLRWRRSRDPRSGSVAIRIGEPRGCPTNNVAQGREGMARPRL